ncbi:uncharacterized protein ACNS7B_009657 isoform 2-T2 [Menidia menidia]
MLRLWVLLVAFLPQFGSGDDVIYLREGGEGVLSPGPVSGPIRDATWKHEGDLVLEFYNNEITFYRGFRGRCELNPTSGTLRIRSLTKADSGSYTAEINEQVLQTSRVQVLSPVPPPTLRSSCGGGGCLLSCEGNGAGVELLEYQWSSDGGGLPGSGQELSITQDTEARWFVCSMLNPVSRETSERLQNPLREYHLTLIGFRRYHYGILAAVLSLLVVSLVCWLFVVVKRRVQQGEPHPGNDELRDVTTSPEGGATELQRPLLADAPPTSPEGGATENGIPPETPAISNEMVVRADISPEQRGGQDLPSEEDRAENIEPSEESDDTEEEGEGETKTSTQEPEGSNSESKQDKKPEDKEGAGSPEEPEQSNSLNPEASRPFCDSDLNSLSKPEEESGARTPPQAKEISSSEEEKENT